MDLARAHLVTFNGGPVDGKATLIERCKDHDAMAGVGVPYGLALVALYEWCEEGGHYQYTRDVSVAEWELNSGGDDGHNGRENAMPTIVDNGGDRFRAGWAAVEKALRDLDAHGICYMGEPSPDDDPDTYITWKVSATFGSHHVTGSARSHSSDGDGTAIVEAYAALVRAFLGDTNGVPA